MNRTERSFTLLELIMVVIIIGIMAGIGIPSFQKAVEKNLERKAFISLIALEGAEKIYMAKNNIYWPPTTAVQNTASINAGLGLNLADVQGQLKYECKATAGYINQSYECKAIFLKNGATKWVLIIQNWIADSDPACSLVNDPCPSCKGYQTGSCPY